LEGDDRDIAKDDQEYLKALEIPFNVTLTEPCLSKE